MNLRALRPGDAAVCDAVIAGLPAWFGMQEGIDECAVAVRTQDGLVVTDGPAVIGFLTWQPLDGRGAEITWMAIRADRRRSGAGRMLIEALVDLCGLHGVEELRVKTLSERMTYAPYAETRAFYRAMGFDAVEEFDAWGPENPGVVMARRL